MMYDIYRDDDVDHHLFVHGLSFADPRDEYSRTLLSDTQSILQEATLSASIRSHLDRVTSLFRDDLI